MRTELEQNAGFTLFGKSIRQYQQLVVEKTVLNTSFNVATSIINKLRWKMREAPDKAKSPKSNITREEGERCNSDQTHKIRSQDAASSSQTLAA